VNWSQLSHSSPQRPSKLRRFAGGDGATASVTAEVVTETTLLAEAKLTFREAPFARRGSRLLVGSEPSGR
jgi:hypothetical protein